MLAIALLGTQKSRAEAPQEPTQTDTTQLRLLLQRFDALRFSEPDSALQISLEAIALSQAVGEPRSRARALKNAGTIHFDRGDYNDALDYYTRSLEAFEREQDTLGISNLQSNIGSVYQTIGDNPRALEYFINSLKNAEAVQNTMRIGTAYLNIGTAYSNDELTYDQAIFNYGKSLEYFTRDGYDLGMAVANINIGELYLLQERPIEAMPHLMEALEQFRELQMDPATPLNYMGQAYAIMGQNSRAIEFYQQALESAREKGSRMEETKAYLGLGETYLKLQQATPALRYLENALEVAKETGLKYEQSRAYEGFSQAYELLGDFRKALEAQQQYTEVQDALRKDDYEDQMSRLRATFDLERKEQEIELLNAENSLNTLQIEKDARAKLLLTIILGLFLAIIAGFVFQFFYIRRSNRRLAFEQNRSEQILLNILPKETADELKEHGFIKAKEFEQITVLFTDFKAFSVIAERISADKLVKSVDYYFKNFDEITERHNLEKVKTIGDAYMCAGGIPTPNTTHAQDAMGAALEILQFVKDTEIDPPKGIYPFKIRIGLNSGPVVAGVVGTRKFAYDIWGSTVNIAARMESGSVPGRINVSENTYQLLRDQYTFTYRGEMEVKNKQVLRMYFVEVPETDPSWSS
ncbi:adenylate/guanylate cyclase domain-containing protein [Robiginitalea sp. M366]|uniref:adenylate/guanylate cyclase domain-containing protein n=1 Tax=Robiginitalea aestuariiviva TaxID=3036903 RepID=UPI00240CF3D6|nr:adenylate/guanylate cyclase domain-containing protein [Robiginitalea aestuariiviva]MDG1572027.1 adenylate/guanylate cyclase domain-containing protein [Robiginitalea aestuariiviva]